MTELAITWDQVRFIWHCIHVWQTVVHAETGEYPVMNEPNMVKSCLLGRMLVEGKDPLPEPPPVLDSAPWYWFVEEHGNAEHNRHQFGRRFTDEGCDVFCHNCDGQVVYFQAWEKT